MKARCRKAAAQKAKELMGSKAEKHKPDTQMNELQQVKNAIFRHPFVGSDLGQ